MTRCPHIGARMWIEAGLRLSIVIPAKNEKESVSMVIAQIRESLGRKAEVILVNGHSTDKTIEKALQADKEVIVLRQHGEGKGWAIRTVQKKFSGDIFVLIDSDVTYDPNEIPSVIEPIVNGAADVVLGSRFKGKIEREAMSLSHYLANKFFSFLVSMKCLKWVSDPLTGFRAMSRKAIDGLRLNSEGFDVEIEMTRKCIKQGFNLVEVPVTYRRRLGKSKLSFRDSWCILKRIIWS